MAPDVLKRILLVGWAVWWTCVLATNLGDAGKALGLLPPAWPFASGNFAFIAETTARYDVPALVNALLFGAAILWEALATALFWRAALVCQRPVIYAAFGCGFSLWLAFMIACELCMAYGVEQTHVRLLTAQAATLLLVVLLPSEVK